MVLEIQWPADRLAFQGALEERNVGDVLIQLWREQISATVVVETPHTQRVLVVRDGHLAFAFSDDPDERLGEILLLHGRIDVAQYVRASREVQKTHQKLGRALIEMGAITAEELPEVLRLQARIITMAVINEPRGHYQVYWLLDDETVPGGIDLNINLPKVVFEGVRRVTRWSIVAQGLGDVEAYPILTSLDAGATLAITLGPEENHILSLCNGMFSVHTICATSFLSSFETARLLWALKLLGIVEMRSQRQPEATRLLSPTPEATPEYQDYMLQELVQRYNNLYQELVETILHHRGEEVVHRFLERVLDPIRTAFPHRMRDVHINLYGEIDYDALVRNFTTLEFEIKRREISSILEDILYSMLYNLEAFLPASEVTAIRKRFRAPDRPHDD